MTHRLIITGESEDPWYVEHDTSCPTADLYGGGYCFDYVCSVGRELANVGLDPELAGLPSGNYEIEYWRELRGVGSFGIPEVVGEGLSLVIYDETSQVQVDPDFWKKIIRDGRKTGFPWKEES